MKKLAFLIAALAIIVIGSLTATSPAVACGSGDGGCKPDTKSPP